jgi:hypothetical protein
MVAPDSIDPKYVLFFVVGSACTQILNLGAVFWILSRWSQSFIMLASWAWLLVVGAVAGVLYIQFADEPNLISVAV